MKKKLICGNSIWWHSLANEVKIKKGSRVYYNNGRRLTIKPDNDKEFIKTYAKLLKFCKQSTKSGTEKDGFLLKPVKKYLSFNYNRNFYCGINRNWLEMCQGEPDLFSNRHKFFEKTIYQYDIKACYPSIFRLLTGNDEIFNKLMDLPKDLRLKTLGALGSRDGITYRQVDNQWEIVNDNELGFVNKYYFVYTTIYSFLNEINKKIIKNFNPLFIFCDAFFTFDDYGEFFNIDFENLDNYLTYQKKGEFLLKFAKKNSRNTVICVENFKEIEKNKEKCKKTYIFANYDCFFY